MNKCLVTKLNGSSNNSELLRLGEMRIGISKVDSPNHWTQGFSIIVNKLTVLEIIGDGYFTDVNLTADNGKKITLNPNIQQKVYVSNGNFEVAILDKYALVFIADYDTYSTGNSTYSQKNKSLSDIGIFKYSTALIWIDLPNTQISGDIANLKTLTALTRLLVYNNQTPLTGEISALSTLSKCKTMSFAYSKLTGDLAILNDACDEVALYFDKGSVLTWSTRPSSAYIIALGSAPLSSNVDKMLQDQAQCKVGKPTKKFISVTGTRTSASDEAVATLQQKGYTVSITKA